MSTGTASTEKGSKGRADRGAGGGARPRRELLTGAAAAALGVVTTETLVGAAPARATQGQDVILGADNTGATARTGIFTSGNKEWAQLADPGNANLGSQGCMAPGRRSE